jgi:Mg/Co/Ni transporter MgtE
MDPGYLALPEHATVTDAMEELKKNEEIVEDLHNLFLVDRDGRLRFTVPIGKLFFASGDTPLQDLASDPLLYVYVDEHQDRITELFDKYNLLTLAVVDHGQRLIGVITVDDIVAVLRQG